MRSCRARMPKNQDLKINKMFVFTNSAVGALRYKTPNYSKTKNLAFALKYLFFLALLIESKHKTQKNVFPSINTEGLNKA